ncbi:hypothetical protein JCM10449v2_006485 [Rhodotorula kratochvilovae]
MAPSSPTTYTVVLRDKRFVLSDSQIRFDSPNHFTGVFLGGNGGKDVVYSDRRPLLFPLIVEWLSGYTDFFPVKVDGLSELEGAKALLVEAEHFKLKKLAARAREAAMDFTGGAPDFSDHLWDNQSASSDPLFQGNMKNVGLWTFRDLQLRTLSSDGLPRVQALFLEAAIRHAHASTHHLDSYKPIDVEYWDSTSQQASVEIDGKSASLAVLLRWLVDPSPAASKLPALVPLANYLRPELTPKEHRIVTLRVKSAIGYWAKRRLRFAHLVIRTEEQGYGHLVSA